MGEFGAVDVDITNVVSLEPLPLFRGLARRETRDAVALETTMQGASAEIWNGVLQTAEDIIQWQEGSAPELDDDRFLGWRQHSALGLRPHGCVGGLGAIAPFQDGFDVEAV